ncbi:MAG TPA: hypothetical protein VHM23_14720 [Actinomycetota bacterium]|jgi:MHS family proline/betaine transporter-like MFS transporter|nr:hypothetical protein [Actinomycetota bacterium]
MPAGRWPTRRARAFFIFLPTHLATERGIPLPRALAGALLGPAVMVALSPALGRLSDRIGRRPLLGAATLSLLGPTVPVYLLIRQGGPVGLPLRLPPGRGGPERLRPPLALGTAPLVQGLLVQRTGNPLVPAWYATVLALLAAGGALGRGETAFGPLDADEPSVASGSSVAGRRPGGWDTGQPCRTAPGPSTGPASSA